MTFATHRALTSTDHTASVRTLGRLPLRLPLLAVMLCAGCGVKQRQAPVARGPEVAAVQPVGTDAAEVGGMRAVGTPAPVADAALSAEFNNLFSDGDIYFAGWPTEQGMRMLAARGVRTVIALKTADQIQEARGYDPRALAKALGINLVIIPVRPDSFRPADVDAFAAALDGSSGPVLVHCGSSNTVGGVWAAYLAGKRGLEVDKALEVGRAAGLKDGPMGDAAERVAGEVHATRE